MLDEPIDRPVTERSCRLCRLAYIEKSIQDVISGVMVQYVAGGVLLIVDP